MRAPDPEIVWDSRFGMLYTSRLPFVLAGLSFFFRAHVPWFLIRSLFDPRNGKRRIRVHAGRAAERIAAAAAAADAQGRLQAVLRLCPTGQSAVCSASCPAPQSPGSSSVRCGRRARWETSLFTRRLEVVQRGLPSNPTTEMDLALWEIAAAQTASESPSLPRSPSVSWLRSCVNTAIDAPPSWTAVLAQVASPAPLYSMIANYSTVSRCRTFARLNLQEERGGRGGTAGGAGPQGAHARASAGRARFCLARARGLLGYREVPRSAIGLLLDFARRCLLPAGEALVEAGQLDTVGDLSFLQLAEIPTAAGEDFRALIPGAPGPVRKRDAASTLACGHAFRWDRAEGEAPGFL